MNNSLIVVKLDKRNKDGNKYEIRYTTGPDFKDCPEVTEIDVIIGCNKKSLRRNIKEAFKEIEERCNNY